MIAVLSLTSQVAARFPPTDAHMIGWRGWFLKGPCFWTPS
jgi:hypothetical protein